MASRETYRKSLTWGKRLILVVLIMGAMIYGVLSLAEKYKEPMRLGMQDYLMQATGHDAEITSLTKLQLTPNIVFGLDGIDIRERAESRKVLLHADKAYISMPFWNLMLGINSYHALEVKGLQVATGYWLPKKIDISIAGISDKPDSEIPPNFLIDGTYNNLPLLVTAEMDRKAGKKFYKYSFKKEFPVTFKLGALEADGIYERGFTSASFKQVQMVKGADRAEFVARNVDTVPLSADIEGTINDVPFNAVLTKSGESNLLKITLASTGADDLKKVKRFVDSVSKDIGWSGKDNELKIEIIPGEADTQ